MPLNFLRLLPCRVLPLLIAAVLAAPAAAADARPVFQSKVVTSRTPGHAVEIDADITGAKELYLVVRDGGNGFGCDWADWAEPRLIGKDGEKKLTELKWKSAAADWGKVAVNQSAGGGELRINGKKVEYGIGTHANSVIVFELPEGYGRFKARGGLDNGGTDQGDGSATSVQFLVFTQKPPARLVASSGGNQGGRDPMEEIEALDVAEGLEVTLFAAEPMLASPANIDIDHRGRVWVCEILNYRPFRNPDAKREEGDRILILSDTDGDGKADEKKVFYQGTDINSPHGVCVLATPDFKGNRVIVSAGDKVHVFYDDDGDDSPDRREVMFSGIGGVQHDHGIHAFVFGPDGKLYFNFGNAGNQIRRPDGDVVVDRAGRPVHANRRPYQEGMVFRCDLDGSNFETLGWNFRNNWMATVDSFGTIWQSDNDDDGNRGVRINYVMEFGNYGYKDELTGAGWQSPRTGMSDDIPTRHWHLNDPGVVPNLLQTGAGSPTGITVYEGDLLPEVFRGQMIHCDAGPSIVRAYPVKDDGAGYTAEIVDILHGARDNWFRPSDVSVAPDGSLIIADWYDPGVGGHAAGDLKSGRLFRVAPPGHKYSVPKFDFGTVDGAIEALKNPNYAVRYVAWQALHNRNDAEPALLKMYEDSADPRLRARALWLLGQIDRRQRHYVDAAIEDSDPNLRIVGIRLARLLRFVHMPDIVRDLAADESPQVRRECLIALREVETEVAAPLWAELAMQHEAEDRWYLEALGIAADGRWDECLEAWQAEMAGKLHAPAGWRDIYWRSRAEKTPEYLAKIIADDATSLEELPRYFRAFDFQADGEAKDAVLIDLAFNSFADEERTKFINLEALRRIKNLDIKGNRVHAEALERVLHRMPKDEQFVTLVGRFDVIAHYGDVLKIAQEHPSDELGVAAIRLLLDKDQRDLIAEGVTSKDFEPALATIAVLGNSADGRAAGMLLPLVKEDRWDLELRRQATRAAAKTKPGAEQLLALAKSGDLDERLKESAAFGLNNAPWPEIRDSAARLFPPPPARDDTPLPPIAELVQMKGDIGRGKEVFMKTGECAKCHVVGKEGKEVGPNLSEIGSKLSRQAMFESILFPSAGISHNYETYTLVDVNGTVLTGVLISRSDDEIVIKGDDAIARTFPAADIEQFKKQPISLMPADLQKKMTAQELIDVVEYLTTLKKE